MKAKRSARWLWVVAGVVGLGLVGALIVRAQVQPPGAGGGAQPGLRPAGIALRIQQQVAEVTAESVAESIENLVQPGMYFWPGGGSADKAHFLMLPLRPEEGEDDVATIVSNRRFLRVYEELAALNPQDASAVLVDAFPRFLKSYREALLFYVAARRKAPPPRPGVRYSDSPSFQVSGPPDGKPDPLGERYRLLALVLIAGDLQLEGAHAAVQDVVKQGLADRELFYAEGEFSLGFRDGMLTMASLYNRQILAHALLRTSPDKARVAQVWAALGKEMQTKDVPVFDAVRTEGDAHFMPGPVDFSKGVMRVEYLPSLSDEEFNLVVEGLMPKEKPPGP
jgi:hypothetical protein